MNSDEIFWIFYRRKKSVVKNVGSHRLSVIKSLIKILFEEYWKKP